jgi:dipeptidyl aminopeptidase/acylaminoacyl peptidase
MLCYFATGIVLALSYATVAQAETPARLLTITSEPSFMPAQRNWKRLGVADWEMRHLERFHRGDGYEGWNIAYKSLDLNMTGVLTRPYIREDDEIKYPLVVLSHGSDRGVDPRYRAVALDLARRGYVVLAPTFRGRAGPEGRSEGVVQIGRNEVIDLLQLAQLGRKLEYVDSQRMAVLGEGHGATAALLAIERSNVFRAAVVVSPLIFSGMAEYGFAGINRLVELQGELFGRELSRTELVRELYAREMLRHAKRIRTPILFIHTDVDPSYSDQRRFLSVASEAVVKPKVREFPGMFPTFLTAADDGTRPPQWHDERDRAWEEIFYFLEEQMPEPPPEKDAK